MSAPTLYGDSAVAGTISVTCIILGTVLTDLLKTTRGTVFNLLGTLIGLLGETGVYLWQALEAGVFGLVAYMAVHLGLVLIACTDCSGAFVVPRLSEDEVSRLGSGPAMVVTAISGFVFLIGEILFGISTIVTGVYRVIPAVLFMTGFLWVLFRPVKQIVTLLGLSLSGAGLIWRSVSLWLAAVVD